MTILIQDIETDGLDPSVIHCICTKEKETKTKYRFERMNEYSEYILDTRPTHHVFHNGLGFDVPVINRLISPGLINPTKVVDTMVVSKLIDYKRYSTHSLKELGQDLGVFKGDYDGGWEVCTPEMIDYCDQDVEVTEAILNSQWKYISDPEWSQSLRLEHDIAILSNEMSETGFKFDKPKATELLADVTKEMDELEANFRTSFPPKLVEATRNKMRYTDAGTLYANITKNIAKYPKSEVEGDEIVFYDYKEFNPGSPKDRVDALWEAGWKPFEKTDGHKKHLRSKRTWR